jgi:hypothetical protein
MNTTEAYPRLMEGLDEVRRRWRTRQVLEGVLLASAGALGVVVALVLLDNLFQPDKLGRALAAAVLWGGLVAGILGLVVRRCLEDRRDDYFAALAEQKHPELRNRLINALQLGRGDQRGFSPELIGAVVRDADRATADVELADSVDGKPARRAAGLALVALLVTGGYAAAFGPYFGNGLARVLLPFGDIAPYTRTQIVVGSVKPGNARVPEGSPRPVVFEVKAAGVVPAVARLHRRTGGGAWQVSDMQADATEPDTFRSAAAKVGESFDYYITVGDARSDTYRVEVVRPPRVARIELVYTLPAYTGLPVRKDAESGGAISALPGTSVDFQITSTKALRRAWIATAGGEVVELKSRGDGTAWGEDFVLGGKDARMPADVRGRVLDAPTTYQIRLLDTDGYENADPLWLPVRLLRDGVPGVSVLAPGEKLSVRPGTKLPLTVEARDDYGLAAVRLLCRVNAGEEVRELARFAHDGPPRLLTSDRFEWDLGSGGLKVGDRVEYWAEATDRNEITGPGKGESRRYSLEVVDPRDTAGKLEMNLSDFIQILEGLLKLQRENRTRTAEAGPFADLVQRQALVRNKTLELARAMEKDDSRLRSVVHALEDLHRGHMAEALRLLESGRDTADETVAGGFRNRSLPVQDKIIAELADILARLQRNEQARAALKRLEKTDAARHQVLTGLLNNLVKNLDSLLKDETTLADKFERMPKKGGDEVKEERMKATKELEELKRRAEKWAKGSVAELAKLGEGFVDDFNLRKDVNKVFEEIEQAANQSKPSEMPVALEDLGASMATKMKEDLESWLPDSADSTKWNLEEPLDKKPLKVPEMPLPAALEDLVGDLLQKAEEFDEEADDVTSAWADNLDQAGWGTGDGPISSFSAKGKTGNDLPNANELNGRSGDGRQGKSGGQMVGDTAKGLPGRKTPARVGNERYEPGQLKQEGAQDPNGATGGGKKAGAGRIGLQGGTPPDMSREMARLSAKQAGLREKAEQVAQKLDAAGVSSTRLNQAIDLMKSAEKDAADRRYGDAARSRREALQKLRTSLNGEIDRSTAARIKRAQDLPPELRNELLQSADEAYPAGYEGLLKSYYKALSAEGK